jgi:hypothetical protein
MRFGANPMNKVIDENGDIMDDLKVLVLTDDESTVLKRIVDEFLDHIDENSTELDTAECLGRMVHEAAEGSDYDLIGESEIEMIAREPDMSYNMCPRCFEPIASVGKEGDEHFLAGHRCGCDEPPNNGWTTPYDEQVPRSESGP